MSPIDRKFMYEHQKELSSAADFLHKELARAKIQVLQSKVKFGQVRVYCTFGFLSLHEFLYPGYVWNRFPKWLMKLDFHLLGPITHQLSRILIPVQERWYRRSYKKAVEKFPEVRESILEGADFPELLRGLE